MKTHNVICSFLGTVTSDEMKMKMKIRVFIFIFINGKERPKKRKVKSENSPPSPGGTARVSSIYFWRKALATVE